MEFTFSGLESAVKRICEMKGKEMGEEERRDLARESMRVAFEHLASRVGWALRDLDEKKEGVKTLVVSGGVASNSFLRHMYVPSPSPLLTPSIHQPYNPPPSLQTPRLPLRARLSLHLHLYLTRTHFPSRRPMHG